MTAAPYTLALVHVGPTLPEYLEDAIAQARLFNTCPIALIANKQALSSFDLAAHDVTGVAIESLEQTEAHHAFNSHSPLDKEALGGFWQYTSERFFYLHAFMLQAPNRPVFHIENDVMLYRNLEEIYPHIQGPIAGTLDSDIRCVPGFIYFKTAAALGHAAEFFVNIVQNHALPDLNDMILWAAYWRTFGNGFFTPLPVIPAHYPQPLSSRSGHNVRDAKVYSHGFSTLQSIFDAAAIGQYLGGVDPRNSQGASTVGFINESAVYSPDAFEYAWERGAKGLWTLVASLGQRSFAVNNLHIHCKNLEAFRSDQDGVPGINH
ncbi:MAG: hypothetical protein HOK28_13020 [Deltaproteobacteria bacterium]|nr:hypothetical protein [Deltaproteobacteria bacterium]